MAQYVLEGPKWGGGAAGTPGGKVTWSFAEANYDSQFVHWAGPPFSAADRQAIGEAFAKWESACNIDLVEVADARNVDIRLGWNTIDGPFNIAGQCSYTYSGGTFVHADIQFDTAERWGASPGGTGLSLFAVALHEIGHALGLDHYDASPAIMNSFTGTVAGLTAGDIAGVRFLYGPPAPPAGGPSVFDYSTSRTAVVIHAGENASILHGGFADDSLFGGARGDVLIGGAGADLLNGGAGTDTASYVGAGSGVVASLAAPSANQGEAKGDTYLSIENIVGSSHADTLTGDAGTNGLDGRSGADRMEGGAGNDVYFVDNVGDMVIEKAGGGRADIVFALVSFTLTANQEIETLKAMPGAANICLTGNGLDNAIEGNAGNNLLSGGAGNDILSGGEGNDHLFGNAGSNIMAGGKGADIFVFSAGPTVFDIDTIMDFSVADDRIALSAKVFTALGPAGSLSGDAFLISDAGQALDARDRIIYSAATGDLSYDADGTGAQAVVRFAHLDTGLALDGGHFLVA